jgi:hypothetical protein
MVDKNKFRGNRDILIKNKHKIHEYLVSFIYMKEGEREREKEFKSALVQIITQGHEAATPNSTGRILNINSINLLYSHETNWGDNVQVKRKRSQCRQCEHFAVSIEGPVLQLLA